jgi:uncharacterized RDD family membrane protein YckC
MQAAGIRVQCSDGSPLGWDTAFGRLFVLGIGICCAGLGALWMLWEPEQRCWHDLAAGTEVVTHR